MLRSKQFWIGVGVGVLSLAVLATAIMFVDAQQLTVSVRNITHEQVRVEVWLSDYRQSSFEIDPLETVSVSFQTSDASLSVKVFTPDKTLEHVFGYVTHSPPQDLYVVQVTKNVGIEGMKVEKLLGALMLGHP